MEGTGGGAALKPSDKWVIPLCRTHHNEVHNIGHESFEAKHKTDLRYWARMFALESPKRRELEQMP